MKPKILRPALVLVATVLAALPAVAQFKVVGPDGRITYTDRPASGEPGKVAAFRAASMGDAAPNAGLPPELRQAASRYPVTLYTAAECTPCDAGRQLLVQRGIPFTEKRTASEEDSQALVRLSGGNTIPVLAVGSQLMRGLNPKEWTTYLDVAGYPQHSKLPPQWKAPPVTPLVAKAGPLPAPGAAAAPARSVLADTPVASPQAFRF